MQIPSNPVWLITGASSGLGLATARAALQAGHRVAATRRKPTPGLEKLAASYPDTCRVVELEVTDTGSIQHATEAAKEAFGSMDILVNNAGFGLLGVLEELTEAQIRHQINVNLVGLIQMTQAVLPTMRAQGGGYIINIASVAGLRGMLGGTLYSATKFAVVGFSESLAQEVKHLGIRVSVVEPGPYRTDWAGRSLQQASGMQRPDPEGPYAEINLKLHAWQQGANGQQPGDPNQIGEVLVSASQAENPPLHMIFGDEAIGWFEGHQEKYNEPSFMQRFPHGKNSLDQK